VKAFLPIVL